jgi:DNA-binding transcriptional regulator YhcF (GntR family)
MEDPDHPQFQWTDADLYDRLHQQVFDAAQNRQVANALPGERYAQRVQQLPATTDAYTTVRRAHTYLVEAGDIEAMTGIANNIMTNQNGPYAQLTDNERTALRAQLQEGIDRVRANEEPTPLSDVIQMDLNRIVDNYDEEVYNEVEGTLSSIGQEYDLDIDPALYIYRVRQHADAALRNNDTTMNSIYENLASQLTRTLRENDAIYDARDRVGNNVNEGLPLTDIQISDIASDYLNNLDNPTPELIRQEADDMRNGMTDLPELRELNGEQALDARNQIANAMEAYADMSEDLEPPEDPGLALPVPEVQRTPEQNAIAQALHYPRFWYQRYPDLPQDVVTGMLHRLNIQHAPPDFAGMRDFAAQGMRRTIFESLNPVQRRQAVAMIDDIANDYQNELQRLDNQPRQQEQYNTVVNAYLGILDANNQFAGLEGLDALRALPQLIRRRSLELRQQLGIANLSADERNALIRDFEELYASRMRDAAEAENRRLTPPGPEGRKRGGLVESLTGVRSYSDLKRDAFNKKYYDDGQAALDFKLRHGTKSDKLGIPYKKYPDYSEEDIVPSKRNEFLNFNQELRRGGRVRRMNSGGINKVRPTPNIPATPAKQNPNTTDYVSKKPVDPGFKETLEKIRGRSNQDLPDNYRAGGSISIDEMKYALMKGR